MDYLNYRLIKFGFLIGERIDDESILMHLKRLGYVYRIVEVDDVYMIVTADFRVNRLDISLRNNRIIEF